MATPVSTEEKKAIYVRVRPEAYELILKRSRSNNRSQSAEAAYMLERLLAEPEEATA